MYLRFMNTFWPELVGLHTPSEGSRLRSDKAHSSLMSHSGSWEDVQRPDLRPWNCTRLPLQDIIDIYRTIKQNHIWWSKRSSTSRQDRERTQKKGVKWVLTGETKVKATDMVKVINLQRANNISIMLTQFQAGITPRQLLLQALSSDTSMSSNKIDTLLQASHLPSI